jgi:predicted kinase
MAKSDIHISYMAKIYPVKPFLLLFYGYPGAGKTYFARQFCENVQAAHLQADRIRGELFEEPRYDKQENDIVTNLMNYMSEEFLAAGLSVAYDTNAIRAAQRKRLYEMARRYGVQPLVIWFQMDTETAFSRIVKRDRRRADDKFSARLDRSGFDDIISSMQNPVPSEDFAVISGKHLFSMQQSAIISKLRSIGCLATEDTQSRVIKPGLVNLIPKNQGRYDPSRRNIYIK